MFAMRRQAHVFRYRMSAPGMILIIVVDYGTLDFSLSTSAIWGQESRSHALSPYSSPQARPCARGPRFLEMTGARFAWELYAVSNVETLRECCQMFKYARRVPTWEAATDARVLNTYVKNVIPFLFELAPCKNMQDIGAGLDPVQNSCVELCGF